MDRCGKRRDQQAHREVVFLDFFRYSQKEIRFTLLAVTKSRGHEAEARIAALKKQKGHFYNHLCGISAFDKSLYPDFEECVRKVQSKASLIASGDMVPELPVENPEEARMKLEEIDAEIAALGEHILQEKARREGYKVHFKFYEGRK